MTKCSEACQASLKLYDAKMNAELSGKLPCDSDFIRVKHELALQKGVAFLEKETFGISAITTEKYRKKLTVRIKKEKKKPGLNVCEGVSFPKIVPGPPKGWAILVGETKDLSFASFVPPPAIVYCYIVTCLQRLVVNHLHLHRENFSEEGSRGIIDVSLPMAQVLSLAFKFYVPVIRYHALLD